MSSKLSVEPAGRAGPIAELRKLSCLISCQPGDDPDEQVNKVLASLIETVNAEAAGLYRIDDNSLYPYLQLPQDFALDPRIHSILARPARLDKMIKGQTGLPWLAVPLKSRGVPLGRLWVVMPGGRTFSADICELITLVSHHLAAALENLRLYHEITRLAEWRGALLQRIISVQDERCRHISRELHDEVSPSLAALLVDVEAAMLVQPAARPHLERLYKGLERTIDEVSRIVFDLRPSLLEDHGLAAALRWYGTERLRPAGLKFHVQVPPAIPRLPDHLETTLYRIGQEAITNAARHAAAANVWLEISYTADSLSLVVRDDGHGFEVAEVLAHPKGIEGVGLFGMQERSALIGGQLSIDSAPGKGTTIRMAVALNGVSPYGQN